MSAFATRVAPAIFSDEPAFRRAVVLVRGSIQGVAADGLVNALAAASQKTLADQHKLDDVWRNFMRRYGAAARHTPAHLNLRRLAQRDGGLRIINPWVTVMSIVSLETGAPAGGDDLEAMLQVGSEARLDLAEGTETFIGLGELGSPQQVKPHELAYICGQSVVCRHGFWRNSDLTKLTTATTAALFNCDGLGPMAEDQCRAAADRLAGLLQQLGLHCTCALLTPKAPGAEIWWDDNQVTISGGEPC
jgi:DNA/RNA-binding domain of Phe-tRNA-synthetase-like protein